MVVLNIPNNPPVTNGKPSGKKGGDALVLAVAMGLSLPQAAKKAGISVSAAYARSRELGFRQEVARIRDDILSQVVGQLLDACSSAIATLRNNLMHPNPMVRNRAAIAILQQMIRGMEVNELAQRITELEDNK